MYIQEASVINAVYVTDIITAWSVFVRPSITLMHELLDVRAVSRNIALDRGFSLRRVGKIWRVVTPGQKLHCKLLLDRHWCRAMSHCLKLRGSFHK